MLKNTFGTIMSFVHIINNYYPSVGQKLKICMIIQWKSGCVVTMFWYKTHRMKMLKADLEDNELIQITDMEIENILKHKHRL